MQANPRTPEASELLFYGGHVAHIVARQDWASANRRRAALLTSAAEARTYHVRAAHRRLGALAGAA